MNKEHNWRYAAIGMFVGLLAFIIIGQIVRIQLSPEAKAFRDWGDIWLQTRYFYFPSRGDIYDRKGNLLAGSLRSYEVAADLRLVENPETIAFALSRVLINHPGYNYAGYYDDVLKAVRDEPNKSKYVVLANYVSEDELAQLKDWAKRYAEAPVSKDKRVTPPSLRGLQFRPRPQRSYPEKQLASAVLGYVDWDGKGTYGIEEEFNDLLAGQPQSIDLKVDPNQASQLPNINHGADLILTIDRDIQAATEKILVDAVASTKSESGTILVVNPRTGEILAMASTPQLDPNQYWNYTDLLKGTTPFNRAVSEDYEPGSVFKILTMSAALDAGAVTPDTVFQDTGAFEIGGIVIHNWDYAAWGDQTMEGCLQHSLNVCLAWVASQLGPTRFYDYMQRFGIGHMTGIDLTHEVSGRLKLPGDKDWYEADLGTNAFGQGVAATPIQMVMAASALANDGQMIAPHVLRSMISKGKQFTPTPTVVGTPISANTAHTITAMLATSLVGESSDALVEGYRVAGKTGTAEIPTSTGYTSGETNASFVGWGPVDDPQILVYVWLEKPQSSIWGSVVAAPVFRDVFREAARLTHLPPDDIRLKLNGQ